MTITRSETLAAHALHSAAQTRSPLSLVFEMTRAFFALVGLMVGFTLGIIFLVFLRF